MVNSVTPNTTSGVSAAEAARQHGVAQRLDPINRMLPLSNSESGAVSTTISRLASGGAPVETNRVDALRAAIKGGIYRIDPQAIASRMVDSDMADTVGNAR